MEEARRVSAARNEAQDLATRRDQVVPADVRFDPAQELQNPSVPGPLGKGWSEKVGDVAACGCEARLRFPQNVVHVGADAV